MLDQSLFWYVWAAITVLSALVTLYDKLASKLLPRHRIREATIFLLAALGGSIGIYLTMLMIRHKTKHRSFMIGMPLIIMLQILVCITVEVLLNHVDIRI